MARIEVAKIPKKKVSKREMYATICYYYHQYKLIEVQDLPARDLNLLFKTAEKIEATRLFNLTQIAAAPKTKNMKGVKTLSEYFKGIANG